MSIDSGSVESSGSVQPTAKSGYEQAKTDLVIPVKEQHPGFKLVHLLNGTCQVLGDFKGEWAFASDGTRREIDKSTPATPLPQ